MLSRRPAALFLVVNKTCIYNVHRWTFFDEHGFSLTFFDELSFLWTLFDNTVYDEKVFWRTWFWWKKTMNRIFDETFSISSTDTPSPSPMRRVSTAQPTKRGKYIMFYGLPNVPSKVLGFTQTPPQRHLLPVGRVDRCLMIVLYSILFFLPLIRPHHSHTFVELLVFPFVSNARSQSHSSQQVSFHHISYGTQQQTWGKLLGRLSDDIHTQQTLDGERRDRWIAPFVWLVIWSIGSNLVIHSNRWAPVPY